MLSVRNGARAVEFYKSAFGATVADPDAMFAKALAAGAREIAPVKDAYGWRLGRAVDPFGHHWEIGRPLK
jgi:PhnB protein